MKHFYYVADWGSQRYLHVDNIMSSAYASYDPKRGLMPTKMKYWDGIERLFIDSGGFSAFTRFAEYPYTVEEYITFIHQQIDRGLPVERVAIMDYPCEVSANRERYRTNTDRIDATIRNARRCIDGDRSMPWVPVIQGYTLDEYKDCWDKYQDIGITSDLWALGSVCARKKTGGIRRIITAVKEYTDANLHTFGMTLNALRNPQVFFSVYSSDSRAWSFRNYHKKAEQLEEYRAKIGGLFKGFERQGKLGGYV